MHTMKNIIKIFVLSLAIGFFIGIGSTSFAQPPAPPPEHGMTGDQAPGGDAPIGSGLVILLSLGATYGAKKIFDSRKRLAE